MIATIKDSVTPASISNIQNVDLTFQGVNASDVNLSNATGITTLTNNGSSANASVSGLSTSTAVVSQNTATNFNLAFAGVSGTSDSAALTLSGVNGGTTTIADIETLTLLSSGSTTNTLAALTAAQLTTLNVGGTAGLTITGALAAVTSVNQPVGGALSGALKLTFDQGAVTATGGAGNDTFTVNGVGNANLSGGAGNETFIFANTFFTAADTVTGGDGSNTLRITAADATGYVAPTTATVTGVQTLSISDALGGNLNASGIASSFTTVNLRGGTNAAATLTGNAGTFGVTIGADGSTAGVTVGDLTINDSGVATTDVLNLTNANTAAQQAFGGALRSLFLNGYETVNLATGVIAGGSQLINAINLQGDAAAATVLNISGANSLGTADAATGGITAGSINASGLTGTAALVMGAAAVGATSITGGGGADRLHAAATGTLIDAGAGKDTLDGGVAADTLRGGAGNDSITAGGGNDTIDGGEGDDRIDLAATLNVSDTIDGGAGTNTVVLTATATAVEGARLANIQTLETSVDQVMSRFSGTTITTVAQSANGAVAITEASANLNTFNTTAAVGNIASSFRRATDTAADALTINAGVALAAASTLAVNDEETITLNTATFAVDLDLTNAVDLTTLNITGSGNTATAIDVTALGATKLSSVTFSGINTTRAVTVDASASARAINLTGGDFAGTYTTGTGADSVSGSALADVITTNAGDDTVSSGGGNDNVRAGGGNDIINLGTGADTVDAGSSADAITLTVDGTTDQVRQLNTNSVAASTTSFATITVGVGDTLTYGNGVDVVNNFLAGAGAGADQLQVLVGGAVPTSLIGQTVANLSAGDAVFYASGSYNAATGRFTISANGTGADTMIIQSTGNGESDILTTNASGLILVGVSSADLAAGNFVGGATAVYTITAVSTVSSNSGAITGGGISAANLIAQGFTTVDGGAIGNANTLTITGETGTQTFNRATGAFTGATNAAVNNLIYLGVDQVNLDGGDDTYTTNSVATGNGTVSGGLGLDTIVYTGGAETINLVTGANAATDVVLEALSFENINASAATGIVTATLQVASTAYTASAFADIVTFADATGNAVAVNAAAVANGVALDLRAGAATDTVTISGLIGNTATGAAFNSQAVYILGDNTADNTITVVTGTANTTVGGAATTDTVTVTATNLADGQLLTLRDSAAGGAYTVAGLQADLLNTGAKAVNATLAAVATQTSTNNGAGLLTIAAGAAFLDGQALTTAGTGDITITGFLGDLTNTASGANSVTLASVATIAITSSTAITIANGTVATGNTVTLAGAGVKTVTGLVGNATLGATNTGATNITTGATAITINASTGAGVVTVNAAAMADGIAITLADTTSPGPLIVFNSLLAGDIAGADYEGQVFINSTSVGVAAQSLVTGAGADLIVGGGGVDTITSGDGSDTITGGGGADVITAGLAADTITGGAGADVFIFTGGLTIDTITDFGTGGVDVLSIDFGDMNTAGAVIAATTILVSDGAGADVVAGASTLQAVAAATTVAVGTDVLQITGGSFTEAQLETALNGGTRALTTAGVIAANDAMAIAWNDGATKYFGLAQFTVTTTAAAAVAAGNINVITLGTLTGVGDVSFAAGNFTFVA